MHTEIAPPAHGRSSTHSSQHNRSASVRIPLKNVSFRNEHEGSVPESGGEFGNSFESRRSHPLSSIPSHQSHNGMLQESLGGEDRISRRDSSGSMRHAPSPASLYRQDSLHRQDSFYRQNSSVSFDHDESSSEIRQHNSNQFESHDPARTQSVREVHRLAHIKATAAAGMHVRRIRERQLETALSSYPGVHDHYLLVQHLLKVAPVISGEMVPWAVSSLCRLLIDGSPLPFAATRAAANLSGLHETLALLAETKTQIPLVVIQQAASLRRAVDEYKLDVNAALRHALTGAARAGATVHDYLQLAHAVLDRAHPPVHPEFQAAVAAIALRFLLPYHPSIAAESNPPMPPGITRFGFEVYPAIKNAVAGATLR